MLFKKKKEPKRRPYYKIWLMCGNGNYEYWNMENKKLAMSIYNRLKKDIKRNKIFELKQGHQRLLINPNNVIYLKFSKEIR